MTSKKRVLITGINGFTGRYVVARFLAEGCEVAGIGSQDSYGGPEPGVLYRRADLTDAADLAAAVASLRPTIVVHLAAIAFVGHADAEAFYKVNLLGTRNLLLALRALKQPLDAVILASSANVYGVSRGGALAETMPPAPANDYAVSKLAMEHLAGTFRNDLPIIVTRPFNYTGRGQSENFIVAKCVGHVRRRAPVIELGNIDVSRDFSDVRALADAYWRLAETAPVGATVNICSGVPHSLREILAMAQEQAGHRIEIRVNPAFVRANEIPSLTGDPTLLHSLLPGFRTPPLAETIGWMLDEPMPASGG